MDYRPDLEWLPVRHAQERAWLWSTGVRRARMVSPRPLIYELPPRCRELCSPQFPGACRRNRDQKGTSVETER